MFADDRLVDGDSFRKPDTGKCPELRITALDELVEARRV
jgi:hypothetical protein